MDVSKPFNIKPAEPAKERGNPMVAEVLIAFLKSTLCQLK
jgi:hypothetical protein